MNYLYSVLSLVLLSMNAANAQGLECVTFQGSPTGGPYGGLATGQVTIASQNLPAGYKVTGGGCDFSGGIGFGYVIWSKPIDGGYSCQAMARSGTEYVIATAHATACRLVPVPVGPPADMTTVELDGTQRIIARDGVGFLKRIQQDLRLCNLAGPKILARWNFYPNGTQVPPWPTSDKNIDPGACIDFVTPSAVMIQNQMNGASRVSWQWYKTGVLNDGDVGPAPAAAPAPGEPVPPVKPYACEELSKAEQATNTSYAKKCIVPLAKLGNYRVCFGKDYVVRNDGGTDWAFSLLDTIVDPTLVPKPKAADYDPRWNAAVGGTCRDYFNIRFLAAMVGPAKPLVPWDAKKVLAVKLSVQEMP